MPIDQLHDDLGGGVVALDRADDDREHEERERVGDHRSARGHAHGSVLREPVVLHDRIRDQRVRRPQRAVQRSRREAVAERQDEEQAEDERERERERAEPQCRPAVTLELVEVELDAGEEHEEQQAELAERLDDALSLDPVEDERPDDRPAEHDPDEPRKP